MTSKLKCPVCRKPLEQVGTSRQYQCGTWGCDASFDMIGTEALWTALIQAKQDLVIAKSTLEYLGYEFAPESPEKNVIAEMRQKALEEFAESYQDRLKDCERIGNLNEELIRTRKALDITVDALKLFCGEDVSYYSKSKIDARDARTALEKITALEQKD